jgi:predicted transcriptional regulator
MVAFIEDLRKSYGYKKNEMATLLGLSYPSYNNYLNKGFPDQIVELWTALSKHPLAVADVAIARRLHIPYCISIHLQSTHE